MGILRIKSTHPESQGEFVQIEEENFDPETMELYGDDRAPAVIPDDWQSLHWKRKVALAREIVGGDDEITADKAGEIIAAEIVKRASAAI